MPIPCIQKDKIKSLSKMNTLVFEVHQSVLGTKGNKDGLIHLVDKMNSKIKTVERVLWLISGALAYAALGSEFFKTVLAKVV